MEGIVSWLKELTVFMVICETVLSFAPTLNYKRYIKPFVGLILLLRITSMLFGTVEADWSKQISVVFEEYENSISQYLDSSNVVKKDNEKLNDNIINIEKVLISPIKIGEEE